MNLFPHDFLISSMDFVHLTIELFAEHIEEITHSNLSLAKNNEINIKQDNSFLIKFYENLLLGKNNNLHSRDLIVESLFNK